MRRFLVVMGSVTGLLCGLAALAISLGFAETSIPPDQPTGISVTTGIIFSAGVSAVALLIFSIAVYALYRLFYWIVTLLLSATGFPGMPPLAVLAAFAIAATVFIEGVTSFWGTIYSVGTILFYDFPDSLVNVTLSSYYCGQHASFDCVSALGVGLANNFKNFYVNSFRFVTLIPLSQFLAAWAVLAWGFTGVRAAYSDGSSPTLSRSLAGVIIVGASYLCLCAILAVSLFKLPVENSDNLKDTGLQTNLESIRLADSVFDQRFPKTDESLKPGFIEKWVGWRDFAFDEQKRLGVLALDRYRIDNLRRIGSREQAVHYQNLETWYGGVVSELYLALNACHEALLTAQSEAARVAAPPSPPGPLRSGDVPNAVAQLYSKAPGPPPVDRVIPSARASADCNINTDKRIGDLPHRADFGSTLGPMGQMASWLLRTESMPLALITGLIGFGLLGALVADFIRRRGDNGDLDMFGLVARGVSAAMVVFLAAYGGIAVFAQSGSDPNPYVVFATCLVGAAFADKVWEKAPDLLGGGGKNTSGAATQPGTTAPTG